MGPDVTSAIHKDASASRDGASASCVDVSVSQDVDIQLRVLGAGQDVGRSCMLLTVGQRNVLLDCGAHPGYTDSRRFPDLESLPSLDAVLITHFHLDHAGALPALWRLLCKQGRAMPPVILTDPTRRLTALMLEDAFEMSTNLGQFVPFDRTDVSSALNSCVVIDMNKTLALPDAPDVSITATPAGHVLGAVMFTVAMGGKRIVYSGDYTSTSDALLPRPFLPPVHDPVDVFITETTHCNSVRCKSRAQLEKEFLDEVERTLNAQGKVLIPVSALGRAAELIAVVSRLFPGNRSLVGECKVFIAAPRFERAQEVYDSSEELLSETTRMIPCATRYDPVAHKGLMSKFGRALAFATSGTLAGGASRDIFEEMCGSPRNLVVMPSYCLSVAMQARQRAHAQAGSTAKPVRCRVSNLSLSAHADARGIARAIAGLDAKHVVLVHGEKNKMLAFRERIARAHPRRVFHAPANGDVIRISPQALAGLGGTDPARLAGALRAGAYSSHQVLGGPSVHALARGFYALPVSDEEAAMQSMLWELRHASHVNGVRRVGDVLLVPVGGVPGFLKVRKCHARLVVTWSTSDETTAGDVSSDLLEQASTAGSSNHSDDDQEDAAADQADEAADVPQDDLADAAVGLIRLTLLNMRVHDL